MTVSRDEVIWAYRLILGREPESEDVIRQHGAAENLAALRRGLIDSAEFLMRERLLSFEQKWVLTAVHGERYKMWLDLGDRFVSYGCLRDNYEPIETAIIGANIEPGAVVIDAGANIGWHVLGMARQVGPRGEVHAFEPRHPTVDYLRKTVEANDLASIVHVHDCGLWDRRASGFLTWALGTNNPGSSFLADTSASGTIPGHSIELHRLDDFKLRRLDFLKIDVEGAEMRALHGGERTLGQHKPFVMCELFPEQIRRVSQATDIEFIDWVKSFGYRCVLIEPGFVGQEIDRFPDFIGREVTNVMFVPPQRTLKLGQT